MFGLSRETSVLVLTVGILIILLILILPLYLRKRKADRLSSPSTEKPIEAEAVKQPEDSLSVAVIDNAMEKVEEEPIPFELGESYPIENDYWDLSFTPDEYERGNSSYGTSKLFKGIVWGQLTVHLQKGAGNPQISGFYDCREGNTVQNIYGIQYDWENGKNFFILENDPVYPFELMGYAVIANELRVVCETRDESVPA